MEVLYTVVYRQNANALNPQIRKAMFEERKQQIRRKIKPGNSQTLWDSVKIATDKETPRIPDKMHLNDDQISKDNIPEVFANFFKTKVENMANQCSTSDTVYNGKKIMDAEEEFFMTDTNILQILKNLKIKNCEGFDRLPLRIFNEGAELLVKPLSHLFKLIYDEKKVPEQWKTAKI